ncbi:glycerophosphodiester phosphodiesterase [Bizionia paragorgiae]|uniref:Glycerophosphoryl diester phosphodiesterase n=1 Tax=Bizionia paragorgiae TaxID=283786 RepID=A0A1H4AJE4_BIZPA|nr:glycerophosphodiester phosphodiesterase family protein [Bizionia paragorgiae]SEA35784.1 glycerophosphoryl diester phosphodiesterase [Bizionia paragorgiae]
MSQIIKIGHRGAAGYCAENTIASFKKALDFNVDGIELDVHLCASGELVVFHDFTLDRNTDATGEISRCTLGQLQSVDVLDGHVIPTLKEVLALIDKKCLVNIELKGKNTATETVKMIQHFIHEHNWSYAHFIVSSFQKHELETVAQLDKKIPLAVLTKANLDEAIEIAKTIGAKIIHPNFTLLSRHNVKRVQEEGYTVNTWTVNELESIARMKSYNVDGIIGDFPDRL